MTSRRSSLLAPSRIGVIAIVVVIFWIAIVVRLFQLQVLEHGYYTSLAQEGHLGYSEIKPRRGEILIKDLHSNETFRLATNTTFDILFADPHLIEDPGYITEKLAPLIFDLETEQEKDAKRVSEARFLLSPESSEEELLALHPKGDQELFEDFKSGIFEKISEKTRKEILLIEEPTENELAQLATLKLSGIEGNSKWIKAYPLKIADAELTARILSPVVNIPFERLAEILEGRNRYVVLHPKLNPSISSDIREIMDDVSEDTKELWKGVGFQEKTVRFYPEGNLASQVVGFVSQDRGVYGIEARFDTQLRGEKGVFRTQLDATGRQVTVGNDIVIEPSTNGDDITLTTDRSIQMEVERILKRHVIASRADSGIALIQEPKTGKIIAMAQYPSFDPNNYGDALEKETFELSKAEKDTMLEIKTDAQDNEIYSLVLDEDSNYRIQIFKKELSNGKIVFEKFKNLMGAGAYINKSVSEIFEPGSTFKAIAMAIALDSGDVTPRTTFFDYGPVEVDEFEIHNSTNEYYGRVDMNTVLAKSLNTGMAFVAREMGRDLFYRYMKKFGFDERSDIEFENEQPGRIKEGSRWAESELVTYSFGQGIAVTPIQMITAASALANGGLLMQPYIIDQTEHSNGTITTTEPRVIRRVISEKTAATINAMMVNAIENGVADKAQVDSHYVAGKTGTAQTYKHGKPLTGPGTTINSFIGFAPINNPEFTVLVKVDRPRSSIWASDTAAPLFKDIADFLFRYYNIPPDKR